METRNGKKPLTWFLKKTHTLIIIILCCYLFFYFYASFSRFLNIEIAQGSCNFLLILCYFAWTVFMNSFFFDFVLVLVHAYSNSKSQHNFYFFQNRTLTLEKKQKNVFSMIFPKVDFSKILKTNKVIFSTFSKKIMQNIDP